MDGKNVWRNGRILIASLTLGAMALMAATGVYYLRQRNAMEGAATQQLIGVAQVKVEQIVNWRRERLGDGRMLQASGITRIARRALTSPGIEPAFRADLLDVMQKLEREFLYTGAALVDRNGAIRLESKVSPSDPARISELGKAASHLSDVTLQDLYWDAKLGRPLMALLIPVHDVGAFVLTIDPDRFLYPFIRWWPGPSKSAETILFRLEGNRAVFLNDARFKPLTALRESYPLRSAADMDGLDPLKSGSIIDRLDYRGVSVLRIIQKVPGSPWILSAKIDRSEVDAPVSHLGWEMASIVALIALANVAGAAFIWRDQQIRFYRQREEWQRQLADETPAFLWTTSSDASNMFINKPLAEFIGGSQEQKLRGSWRTYLHPEDMERVSSKFYECVAAACEFADEHRLRRFNGEYRWFVAKGRPRFSHQGEYLGHAGALLDITERRIAEQNARESAELVQGQSEALKRREAQLVEAQHMARIGSYEWDVAAGKVYRSAELYKIFGAPQGELELNVSPAEIELILEEYLRSVHPDDRSHAQEVLDQSFREHTPFERDERYIRSDGSVRVLRSQGKWIYENGRPLKLIGTCQDITERKLAEQQLEAANAALAEELAERARAEKEIQALSARLINAQEEERSRLARELHDDLSQQIAALSVALSNLKRAIPSELAEPRSQSERIQEKLYHLGESTRRLSHDLHPAILQYSGLDAALRAYCSELGRLSGIHISFRLDGSFAGLPPAIALCVYRIAQEALGNVVKHAQTDHARVALKRREDTIQLTVSDHGIGMNFDYGGASPGLGLTSMRERARLVNGTVGIQSSPGRGTTLTVSVPITAQASDVLRLETVTESEY